VLELGQRADIMAWHRDLSTLPREAHAMPAEVLTDPRREHIGGPAVAPAGWRAAQQAAGVWPSMDMAAGALSMRTRKPPAHPSANVLVSRLARTLSVFVRSFTAPNPRAHGHIADGAAAKTMADSVFAGQEV
jgi:hypothetical protein